MLCAVSRRCAIVSRSLEVAEAFKLSQSFRPVARLQGVGLFVYLKTNAFAKTQISGFDETGVAYDLSRSVIKQEQQCVSNIRSTCSWF